VARGALFPTVAAVVLASTIRQATLIGEFFHRQTLGVFEPVLHVEYLVLDFGGRGGAIDLAKANLLVSDLDFNDTHRKIIFQAASDYYRLLNAEGQREAAEVSLKNAQTVEEDAQNRLNNGLAALKTSPAAIWRRSWVCRRKRPSRCRASGNWPRRAPWLTLLIRTSIARSPNGRSY
jgi:outer membrane protein TolC